MRTLVVGGSGFIGYNLVLSLYEVDYHVAVVDKVLRKFTELNLSQYGIDLHDDIALDKVFEIEKPQMVYYLVTSNVDYPDSEDVYHYVNLDVLGLVRTLHKCKKYNVEKIIFVSSFDISYDDCADCMHRNRYTIPNMYLRSLNSFTCEMLLQYYKDKHNLNYVSLRTSTVYGFKYFDDWQDNGIFNYIEDTIMDKPIKVDENKESYGNYLYIGDLVSALTHSLRKDINGIYNVYNKYYTIGDIMSKINKYSGKKPNVQWGNKYNKMKNLDLLAINSLTNNGWSPLVDLDAGIYSIYKLLGVGKGVSWE